MNKVISFLLSVIFLVSSCKPQIDNLPLYDLSQSYGSAFRSVNILFLEPEEIMCIQSSCLFEGSDTIVVLTRSLSPQIVIKSGAHVVMADVTFIMPNSQSIEIEAGALLEVEQNVRFITVEKIPSLEQVFSLVFNVSDDNQSSYQSTTFDYLDQDDQMIYVEGQSGIPQVPSEKEDELVNDSEVRNVARPVTALHLSRRYEREKFFHSPKNNRISGRQGIQNHHAVKKVSEKNRPAVNFLTRSSEKARPLYKPWHPSGHVKWYTKKNE